MTLLPPRCAVLALVVLSFGLFPLTGCGDDSDDDMPVKRRRKRAAPAAAKPAAEQPTQAEKAPGAQWTYSPVGKRDPFRSYLAELDAAKADEPERKHQPTEEFEIGQYRLTALVTGSSQPRAMVEDPRGQGHTLRVGARLGKRKGRVQRITRDGIVVVEEFIDGTGEVVRVPITINLPKEEIDLIVQ